MNNLNPDGTIERNVRTAATRHQITYCRFPANRFRVIDTWERKFVSESMTRRQAEKFRDELNEYCVKTFNQ